VCGWAASAEQRTHPPSSTPPQNAVSHTHISCLFPDVTDGHNIAERSHLCEAHRQGLAFTDRKVDMWLAIRSSRASWWSTWQRRRHSTTQQRTRVTFCVKKQLSRRTNLCTTFALCACSPPAHPHIHQATASRGLATVQKSTALASGQPSRRRRRPSSHSPPSCRDPLALHL